MNAAAIVTALPIGVAFGVILERAGLGDPRVIAAQFTARNFAVVRVMFGAIVTAMLGVTLLSAAGAINAENIAIPPTNIAAQTIGAVIFGGGFAIASLCPGTACVAAASGKREGIITVVGLFVGTAATAILWPLVEGVMNTGLRESARLPEDLGVSSGLVVLLVTVTGIVAMAIAQKLHPIGTRSWNQLSGADLIALTLAGSLWSTQTRLQQSLPRLAAIASEISREADHVDPLDLAEWIRDAKPGLRIVDVREGVDTGTYVIPGAQVVALDSIPSLKMLPAELVVLYSDGGTHAAQAWVLLRARGVRNIRVLKDGMAAWEDEVMRPLPPARIKHGAGDTNANDDAVPDTAVARFARARALSLWFGGRPRVNEPTETQPSNSSPNVAPLGVGPRKPAASARRRNTC